MEMSIAGPGHSPGTEGGWAAEWGTDELPPSGREGSSLRLSLGA